MASGQASELQSAIALIKTLTNAQLKDILRVEGLAVSGVKASLQMRIINCWYIFPFINAFQSCTDGLPLNTSQTLSSFPKQAILKAMIASESSYMLLHTVHYLNLPRYRRQWQGTIINNLQPTKYYNHITGHHL